MRRAFLYWLLAPLWLAFLLAGSPVRADEKGKGSAESKTVKAKIVQDGKESEKTFDLSKPKEHEEFKELLRQGTVKDLSIAEPDKVKEAAPNLLELKADLGLWTLVVFLLLLSFLMWFPLPGSNGKSAWKMMLEGLDQRERNIAAAMEQAEQAKQEAQQVREHMDAELAKMHEQVRQQFEEARREAQRSKEEMLTSAKAEIETERNRLRREIELARDHTLQELWKQTAQLATLVSAKAVRRHLSEDDHRALVDEALNDLQRVAEQRGQALGDGHA